MRRIQYSNDWVTCEYKTFVKAVGVKREIEKANTLVPTKHQETLISLHHIVTPILIW